jgi:hypothetical protein
MTDKLNIANEMRAFDTKDRNFYKSLTDEERKKFSNFLMIRWGSSVQGSAELQQYYLLSCNENLNKHFFDLAKYPELQWLSATTVSPGMGTFRHDWIKQKKRESSSSKTIKFLRQLYPDYKEDELELLAKINSAEDLKQLARKHGWDDRRIKAELSV